MEKTLTILHVNLAKNFRGGERQTELLIRALSNKTNIKQILACRVDSPLKQKLTDIKDLVFVTANHQLEGHFSAPSADIVHAHEAKAVHWAWLHKVIRKTPYILTRRVDTPVKDRWFNQKTYRNASVLVGISTLISNHMREKNWGEVCQIPSVLAHLISDEAISNEFRSLFPDKIIVGHIGALVDKHKGQKVLIESANILEQSNPELHFVFFGDGADEEELQQLSQDNNNISWMGFKPNIGDYIPTFDIFAFPSRNEGLGSTLLDIMDAGVPIVAANVGGIPDIVIHEETGLLVPPNDSESLAQAIIKLSLDKPLQSRLTECAKSRLEKYTPKAMADSYHSLYKKITS
ncbi:glycosyltransferase family 4 protein [Marinomonas transparens]|uniref:Glycosyltransferase family 4 protein n=1 Tax=Marinomonas transparens TaxID=2795388 RepID=A0A934JM03_9GAMM|nr:glycosyltransferase family 4 protein [Marinomonas transparens]MBJ7536848.1 glycosyltransferase family 4 protein [Marinomonas transparens]